MLRFACDYQEGCLPAILDRLIETNLVPVAGTAKTNSPKTPGASFAKPARRPMRASASLRAAPRRIP